MVNYPLANNIVFDIYILYMDKNKSFIFLKIKIYLTIK